jgi:hypothetical protein
MTLAWGREICGERSLAESREWLCTNGIGGFSSGTVAGVLTRRYHGLLIAALKPPLGRTLLVAKADEQVEYDGLRRPLFTNRWADGTVDPHGYEDLEEFRLEGTTPVWTYACADARIEKRVFMELGANTTYVRYALLRASRPVTLELKILVNYRDYHGSTRGDGWQMRVEPHPDGLRVVAFEGAHPFVVRAQGSDVALAHEWYRGFRVTVEDARGLDAQEDHLYAGTLRLRLEPGVARTVVFSAEPAPSLDGEAAWARRQAHEADLLGRWHQAQPTAAAAPVWIRQLVLAADQFVVRRPLPDEPDGMSILAGYHWFGDWGRDTMISLPGLVLATGNSRSAAPRPASPAASAAAARAPLGGRQRKPGMPARRRVPRVTASHPLPVPGRERGRLTIGSHERAGHRTGGRPGRERSRSSRARSSSVLRTHVIQQCGTANRADDGGASSRTAESGNGSHSVTGPGVPVERVARSSRPARCPRHSRRTESRRTDRVSSSGTASPDSAPWASRRARLRSLPDGRQITALVLAIGRHGAQSAPPPPRIPLPDARRSHWKIEQRPPANVFPT